MVAEIILKIMEKVFLELGHCNHLNYEASYQIQYYNYRYCFEIVSYQDEQIDFVSVRVGNTALKMLIFIS